MNGLRIDVRSDPAQEEKDFILNSLAEFNESQVRDARVREFGIFASNESGAIVAGLLGFTLWNGCFISALWVAETLRRKGIGRQLLATVEEFAVQNDCSLSRSNIGGETMGEPNSVGDKFRQPCPAPEFVGLIQG